MLEQVTNNQNDRVNILFEYDPVSFEENSEESFNNLFGFEDYTDPNSEFLNLKIHIEDNSREKAVRNKNYFGYSNENKTSEEKNTKISKEIWRKFTNEDLDSRSESFSFSCTKNEPVKKLDKNDREILNIRENKEDGSIEPVKISEDGNAKNKKTSGKAKKRKCLVTKKGQYKQRKDVLLKSILRKCRKYYQDAYTSYTRIKFLESPEAEIFENPDIFPNNLDTDNSQQLSQDSLDSYVRNAYCGDRELEGLSLYIGKIL